MGRMCRSSVSVWAAVTGLAGCLMGSWCGPHVLGSGDRLSLLSSASTEPAPSSTSVHIL